MAEQLVANFRFYANNTVRVLIDEVDGAEERFRISSEENFALNPGLQEVTYYSENTGDYINVILDPY